MKQYCAVLLAATLLLAACVPSLGESEQRPGIAWAPGSFDSNGERIYFTATDDRSQPIPYRGGPDASMMMMGDIYACASCHGPDARGGVHVMHMQVMDAPDIRWTALAAHEEEEEHGDQGEHEAYDLGIFRLAVVEGKHPDGEALSNDMPRWNMDDQDLADLATYLQSLP